MTGNRHTQAQASSSIALPRRAACEIFREHMTRCGYELMDFNLNDFTPKQLSKFINEEKFRIERVLIVMRRD